MDHPRSRGVYIPKRTTSPSCTGSSPLARGLPRPARAASADARIIPARAGFTAHWTIRQDGMTDHPRSRGVYGRHGRRRRETGGSSPLARGLHRRRGPGRRLHRIIPARAGFTLSRRNSHRSPLDHPRSRGVYSLVSASLRRRRGSSPLARGLHQARRPHPRGRRIIPARAGFTENMSIRISWSRDHPRSRGVYISHSRSPMSSVGSSPLARGLQKSHDQGAAPGRIIPARAGFTRTHGPPLGGREDHPRSRGVYVKLTVVVFIVVGSSPLARGLP